LTVQAWFDIHNLQLIDINIDLGVAGKSLRGM
jgi:hypothetical protein